MAKMVLTARCRKASSIICNSSRDKRELHRKAIRSERAAFRSWVRRGDWESPDPVCRGTERDLW